MERRNLKDLWQSAFPFGIELGSTDKLKEFSWNFENLEKALQEGGELHGKTVYLFVSIEPHVFDVNGEPKMVPVPFVVAVDCPFPPSDQIGINLVHTGKEEIVPMKAMKMEWEPYVPPEDRFGKIGSLKTKIFTLCWKQRRSVHMNTERAEKYFHCMPYYPLNHHEDDGEVIRVVYPRLDPPVPIVYHFYLGLDDYKAVAAKIVKTESLPEDEREKIEEFLKDRVEQGKKELEEAVKARKKAIEDMDPEQKEALENIQLYKFYPVKTPDTPDVISKVQSKEYKFSSLAIRADTLQFIVFHAANRQKELPPETERLRPIGFM